MRYILYILIFLSLLSCNNDYTVDVPLFSSSIINETVALDDFAKGEIEGIYYLTSGNSKKFGDTVVIKSNGDILSVYTGRNQAYMLLKGGSLSNSIVFEGYWRYALSTETGLIRFMIAPSNGAESLLNGQSPDSITIHGYFTNENESQQTELHLSKARDLKYGSDFYIVAHRGGGRNADHLPASENSLEIIRYAEAFGANAIEIDIRLTKDNIPILYHDDKFNPRLVKSEYLIGDVENYYYFQVKNFCTLINGETIPTLSEALELVLNETNLRYVWLDIKSPEALDKIIPIQLEYMKKAKEAGRDLLILDGIPTEDILERFLTKDNYESIPALCELDIDKVSLSNALVWAPRWTLGLLNEEVETVQAEGRKALVWTLDDPVFIEEYINNSKFDGILTNYPSIVAYEYYMFNN